MGAILIIFSIFYNENIYQTSTPMKTIAACEIAADKVNTIKLKQIKDYGRRVMVTAFCVENK